VRCNNAMTNLNPASSALVVPPAVIVHGINDLAAALVAAAELGRALTVISAPAAAASGGALWFRALVEAGKARNAQVPLTAVLDCADQPGHALGALRVGLTHLALDHRVPAWSRVEAIAQAQGAVLYGSIGPVLDVRFFRDPVRACREWLVAAP
jgi:hypothetical protein